MPIARATAASEGGRASPQAGRAESHADGQTLGDIMESDGQDKEDLPLPVGLDPLGLFEAGVEVGQNEIDGPQEQPRRAEIRTAAGTQAIGP